MILAVIDFLQLMPTFVQGSHTLHNVLVGVTEVLSFCGILLLSAQAAREHSVGSIWPMLVRLIVVVILVGNLSSWGDLLNDAVNDVDSLMGLDGVSGGAFAAYRQAVAQKFGIRRLLRRAVFQPNRRILHFPQPRAIHPADLRYSSRQA